MSDSVTERSEVQFMPNSLEKPRGQRQSRCITEFSTSILIGAAVAVSLVLWTLIFSVIL